MRTRPVAVVTAVTLLVGAAVLGAEGSAPHAGMMRYPDVSATSIVFLYAGDLWLAPREGGTAAPLASPAGEELFPRLM